MRVICQCGWPLHASKPIMLKCGQCGRLVSVGRIGWGDMVAAIIDRLGGRLYKRLRGGRCGCAARQAKLNSLGDRFRSRLFPQR